MRQGSRGRASCQPTGLNPAPSTIPAAKYRCRQGAPCRASLPGPNQGDPPEVESLPFRSQRQCYEQDRFRFTRQSAAGENRKPLAAHAASVRYTAAAGACLSFRKRAFIRTVTRSLGTRLRLHTNMWSPRIATSRNGSLSGLVSHRRPDCQPARPGTGSPGAGLGGLRTACLRRCRRAGDRSPAFRLKRVRCATDRVAQRQAHREPQVGRVLFRQVLEQTFSVPSGLFERNCQWMLFRYSDGFGPSNTPNLPTSDTAPT